MSNIKLPRCKNGTRRNKKTKMCENIIKQPVSKKTSKIKLNSNIVKSYSPTINKDLITIIKKKAKTNINYNKLIGCNSTLLLENINSLNNIKDIKINTSQNKCVSAFSKKGQTILLNNLKLINKINCDNIVVPTQILSNCWFNCFIMSFFISDKGRKFFRFFREIMITGKLLNNKSIKPPQLRNAFMLLNIAIDSCYNHNNDITMALNTNTIIKLVYKSIHKHKYLNIKNINEPGNPLAYYTDIMNYLDLNNIIKILNIRYSDLIAKNKPNKLNYTPHLLIITQRDIDNRKHLNNIINIRNIKYKLDSIIIRNINKHHFISCFHCGGDEIIYDGASNNKLNGVKWSMLLNRNTVWSLKYKNKPVYYNFFNCYALYFYYRI
jgi:hypothetical protein